MSTRSRRAPGSPPDKCTLGALAEAGLDHVQISIQDSDAASADHIAGYDGAFARKRALAAEVVRHQLLLTVNAVVHRANIDRIGDMVDLALALAANRIEIAHVQYYGWALRNCATLPGAGRARGERRGGAALAPSGSDRHRRRGAGLLRTLSKALPRRVGSPFAQRDACRQGAALPC